ncbi:MAG: hypothetical protein ACJA08_001008 [Cyclobacteriaceae bacterium]|jgi:hypothetical protein
MSKKALLVALGEVYGRSGSQYEKLAFPERNVLHFGNFLKGLGWEIELLLNENASARNILETIDQLSVQSGTKEMLIYLSGHTDKFGGADEVDGSDEYFISYDNTLAGSLTDYLDDNRLTNAINQSLSFDNCSAFTCFFETCYSDGLIDYAQLMKKDQVGIFASSSENIQTFFSRGENGNSFYNRALRKAFEINPSQTYEELGVRLSNLVAVLARGRRFFRPTISIGDQLLNHKLL